MYTFVYTYFTLFPLSQFVYTHVHSMDYVIFLFQHFGDLYYV